jgi:hypothetical protein
MSIRDILADCSRHAHSSLYPCVNGLYTVDYLLAAGRRAPSRPVHWTEVWTDVGYLVDDPRSPLHPCQRNGAHLYEPTGHADRWRCVWCKYIEIRPGEPQ